MGHYADEYAGAERARVRDVARRQAEAQGWFVAEADPAIALREEIARLREQMQRLIDQHGTFPYMGYKSDLKGL